MTGRSFEAPWSRDLKFMSALMVGVVVAVSIAIASTVPGDVARGLPHSIALALPFAALVGPALFAVRGFTLERDHLLVHRLLWTTRVSLVGLERAWHDPRAMNRSLRLWGNGGFFAISGYFRNKALGIYRAFVTDPARAVVLVLGRRTVVVSPDDPSVFLQHLRVLAPAVVLPPERDAR